MGPSDDGLVLVGQTRPGSGIGPRPHDRAIGRNQVPGERYGLPDVGTYVISDGNYVAGMHQTPAFVVTGPDGESVPVEFVPSHRYGHEDNALALLSVPRAGRYRLQVEADGNALARVPSTVTDHRSWDGSVIRSAAHGSASGLGWPWSSFSSAWRSGLRVWSRSSAGS